MGRWGTLPVLAAAVLLLAAVAEGQCPMKEQFNSCVQNANTRYMEATKGLDKTEPCFKLRACEFLKDVYLCVEGGASAQSFGNRGLVSCCKEDGASAGGDFSPTDMSKAIAEKIEQLRPFGIFDDSPTLTKCDAINPCSGSRNSTASAQPDFVQRAPRATYPCCPFEQASVFTRAVGGPRGCCRSADCSLCNKPVADYVLDNTVVPADVHIRLEATEVGNMCPHGVARQLYICNQPCSTGGPTIASTNNNYVFHKMVSSTVPTTESPCPDCCLLTFDSPEDLPCANGCGKPEARCHMCAAQQAYEGPGAPVRCGGYKDFDSCAKLSNASSDDPVLCRGHACVRTLFTFYWPAYQSIKLTVAAPFGKVYTWAPTVSGWLVIRYQIRFEKDRRTCCGRTADGLQLQSCCSTGAAGGGQHGAYCAGNERCSDGRCVAECDCPLSVDLSNAGARPEATAAGQVPCWVTSSLKEGTVCRMFSVQLPFSASSVTWHAQTGFKELLPLKQIVQKGGSTFSRAAPPIQRLDVSGAGLVFDVEFAAEVESGRGYTLSGGTFSVLTPSQRELAAYACPEVVTLPLKPTTVTMRSYILPRKDALFDALNAAAGDVTLVDTCETIKSCDKCVAFQLNNALKCEWVPWHRVCVQEGTTEAGTPSTLKCGTLKPENTNLSNDVNFGKFAVWIAIPVVFVLVLFCLVRDLRNNTEAMAVHLNYEKALEMRELAFDEARRHDSSMLQKRKVERRGDGAVHYVDEVMHKRLQNPHTPYGLMDPPTLIKHFRKHGFQQQD